MISGQKISVNQVGTTTASLYGVRYNMRYLIGIAIFTIITLYPFKALAKDMKSIIVEVSQKEGAPSDIMSAICWVESKHNHKALNKKDGNGGRDSNGLCQVQYRT